MAFWIQCVIGVLSLGVGVLFIVFRKRIAARNARRFRERFGIVGEPVAQLSLPIGSTLSGVILLFIGVISLVRAFT
jgi:hypothetical protein